MSQATKVPVTVKGDSLSRYGIGAGDVLYLEAFTRATEMKKGRLYAFNLGSRSDIGMLCQEKGSRRWWAELPHYNAMARVTRRNLAGRVARVMENVRER